MARVAVVYHSQWGHTKVIAEAVVRGAASVPGTVAELFPVEAFGPPDAQKQYRGTWDSLAQADAIVWGAPTYMGSVSAAFKQFMEHTSALWLRQEWKDKLAAGFTNSGSQHGDKLNTLWDLAHFAFQHGMVWIGLDLPGGYNSSKGSPNDLNRIGAWLGAMSQSNVDQQADTVPPESDQKTAEHLGRRVAGAALRWRAGKAAQ